MTTGVIKGKDLMLFIGAVAVGHATTCDLNISTNMIDITSKDSNGWKEILADLKEFSISCDAFTAWDAAYGAKDILTAKLAGTKLTVKLTTDETGDEELTGDVYIDNFQLTGSNGDASTYNFSGAGTGALVQSTKAI